MIEILDDNLRMERLMDVVKLIDDNKVLITFLISCASLCISARTAWLDRSRMTIKARPYTYDRGDGILFNHLDIYIYNHGRRDAAIDRIVYKYSDGYSTYHGSNDDLIVLKENQRKIVKLDYSDLIMSGSEGDVHYLEDIVIVDIRGKEYTIPNCKEMIDKVHQTR